MRAGTPSLLRPPSRIALQRTVAAAASFATANTETCSTSASGTSSPTRRRLLADGRNRIGWPMEDFVPVPPLAHRSRSSSLMMYRSAVVLAEITSLSYTGFALT
jgi:hypothetical protein